MRAPRTPLTLSFEHEVAAPVAAVFGFHEDPANLGRLLEGVRGFRLLHHGSSNQPGSETWFEVGVARCVPVVMGFRHQMHQPPHRFSESLIHGPFRVFEHRHDFESSMSGTIVRDTVDVLLPWYYGGRVVTRLLVAPMIRRMFLYRHQNLARVAGWEMSASAAPRTTSSR